MNEQTSPARLLDALMAKWRERIGWYKALAPKQNCEEIVAELEALRPSTASFSLTAFALIKKWRELANAPSGYPPDASSVTWIQTMLDCARELERLCARTNS
jgi:hypothetical protein